jgi:hypothetical protein
MAAWPEFPQERCDILCNDDGEETAPIPLGLLHGIMWGCIFSVPLWTLIWFAVMR